MVLIGFPETSVTVYQSTLYNIPEDLRSEGAIVFEIIALRGMIENTSGNDRKLEKITHNEVFRCLWTALHKMLLEWSSQ
jgi:hypothetical protein